MVDGFLLHPAHIGDVPVVGQDVGQLVQRQRVEPLHGDNGDLALQPALRTLLDELPAHLARTQDELAYRRGIGDRRVGEHRLPGARDEFGRIRGGRLVAQHRLRGCDDDRAMHVLVGVLAQQVEIVGRCRGLADCQLPLAGEVEEPFDTCRGVIGPLPLISVWQQEDDSGVLAPLGSSRGDELVDDGLGTIGEVTELCFPQHQGIWASNRISVFEAHGSILTEQ